MRAIVTYFIGYSFVSPENLSPPAVGLARGDAQKETGLNAKQATKRPTESTRRGTKVS